MRALSHRRKGCCYSDVVCFQTSFFCSFLLFCFRTQRNRQARCCLEVAEGFPCRVLLPFISIFPLNNIILNLIYVCNSHQYRSPAIIIVIAICSYIIYLSFVSLSIIENLSKMPAPVRIAYPLGTTPKTATTRKVSVAYPSVPAQKTVDPPRRPSLQRTDSTPLHSYSTGISSPPLEVDEDKAKIKNNGAENISQSGNVLPLVLGRQQQQGRTKANVVGDTSRSSQMRAVNPRTLTGRLKTYKQVPSTNQYMFWC